MLGREKRIDALRDATERKRQDALDKTDAAITKLLKENKPISFSAVAKTAGVSTAYLYKYDEIKNRIQQKASSKKQVSKSLHNINQLLTSQR